MQQPMSSQPHMPGAIPAALKNKKLGSSQMVVAIMLFAVAILAALVLVFMVVGGPKGIESAVKKNKYQAVFLNSQDGQVYFGKLVSYNDQYYKLSDIYYVRVENKLQPDSGTTNQTQQSISLAKLGNELHGPEDEMYISKDKVLFWENLKDDGQVVKAITEYKKNPSAATQDQTSSTNQGTTNSSTNSTSNTNTTNSTSTNKTN